MQRSQSAGNSVRLWSKYLSLQKILLSFCKVNRAVARAAARFAFSGFAVAMLFVA